MNLVSNACHNEFAQQLGSEIDMFWTYIIAVSFSMHMGIEKVIRIFIKLTKNCYCWEFGLPNSVCACFPLEE